MPAGVDPGGSEMDTEKKPRNRNKRSLKIKINQSQSLVITNERTFMENIFQS